MVFLVRRAQPVQAAQVDAQCAICRSYVHRYLDRCPICGDGRTSAFRPALDEWQAFAVADGPPRAETEAGEKPPPSPALAAARDQAVQAFGEAEGRFRRAGQLVLRYEGGLPGIPAGHDVKFVLVNGQLEVRDFRSGRLLTTFDPGDVLAAIPSAGRRAAVDAWSNVFTSGSAPSSSVATWGGAFTVVFVRDGAGVQFGLANRPGFFTAKGRVDYFVGLAREFADLCGTAARQRELVDGPVRYAEAIGLRAAPDAASHPTAGDYTLAELLEQLEAAFRAGLITAGERDSKREEILRRF